MNKAHESHLVSATERLQEVAEEFSDAIGRRPTSTELFEILTWALKSTSDDILADIQLASIIALKPQVKKGAKPFDSWVNTKDMPSAVSDLNDATFVVAGDFLVELTNAIKQETGQLPTLDALCKSIIEVLHRCDENLLADISPAHITGVKAEVKKQQKIASKIGDIVAIPAKNGEDFIAIILAKNKYGVAYGFFEGTSKLKPVSIHAHPPVRRYPIYSSDEFTQNGRWKIIGHDEELRSLFPADPETYFRKQVIPGAEKYGGKIGPYGSGKTATGALRDLTQAEAEEIGLLSGQYRQVYLPEILEKYLNAQLPEKGA